MPKQCTQSCSGSISESRQCFSVQGKLLGWFYKPLVLLHVLDSTHSDHSTHQLFKSSDAEDLKIHQLCREFLDQLAYVCDHVKGGVVTTVRSTEPSRISHFLCLQSPMLCQHHPVNQLDLCSRQNQPFHFTKDTCMQARFPAGGATVTALVLESTLQGVVFWVATNKTPEQLVTPFLHGLLKDLNQLYNSDQDMAELLEDCILNKIVKFNLKRIETY